VHVQCMLCNRLPVVFLPSVANALPANDSWHWLCIRSPCHCDGLMADALVDILEHLIACVANTASASVLITNSCSHLLLHRVRTELLNHCLSVHTLWRHLVTTILPGGGCSCVFMHWCNDGDAWNCWQQQCSVLHRSSEANCASGAVLL